MQLVVIAGGFGKRLRPLTLTRPKALIPLVDRPLVLHILDSLPPSCDEAIIAVNYLFEQVRDFFREHESRIAVRVVDEPTPLGTGGALKNVERYLRGPFAVYNGDIVDTIDFDSLVQTHRKAGGIGTIAVGRVDDPSDFGAVDIVKGRIARFVEKPARGETASHLVNAGRYVFEPGVFDFIEPGRPVSMEREVFPGLIAEGLTPYRFEGWWSACRSLPMRRSSTTGWRHDPPLRHERHPRRRRRGDERGTRGQGRPRDRDVLRGRLGRTRPGSAPEWTHARARRGLRPDVRGMRRDRRGHGAHAMRPVLRRQVRASERGHRRHGLAQSAGVQRPQGDRRPRDGDATGGRGID